MTTITLQMFTTSNLIIYDASGNREYLCIITNVPKDHHHVPYPSSAKTMLPLAGHGFPCKEAGYFSGKKFAFHRNILEDYIDGNLVPEVIKQGYSCEEFFQIKDVSEIQQSYFLNFPIRNINDVVINSIDVDLSGCSEQGHVGEL